MLVHSLKTNEDSEKDNALAKINIFLFYSKGVERSNQSILSLILQSHTNITTRRGGGIFCSIIEFKTSQKFSSLIKRKCKNNKAIIRTSYTSFDPRRADLRNNVSASFSREAFGNKAEA